MKKEIFYVTGMACAGCAVNVQTELEHHAGVKYAKVNFASSSVTIEYDEEQISPEELNKAVTDIGYGLVMDEGDGECCVETLQQEEYRLLKKRTIGAVILALPVFIIGMFFMHLPHADWIMLVFTLPVLLVFGRVFYVNAWQQLKHRHATMDTLVAVSTGVAFLFSLFNTFFPEYWTDRGLEVHVYYEAVAVIIALILTGRLLEHRAKTKTSSAIRKLIGMQPKMVVRVLSDGTEQEIPVKIVEQWDILQVKPGDRIPVDGVVTEGVSFVDESMITGEPIPVEKTEGRQVFAGTINQKGSFRFRAENVGESTVLARIIRLIQEAQGTKAPVQKLVDKIAGIFVPVVLGISLLTFAIWMLAGGENAFTHALLASVTVLVIACPCALGLATPTAIIVGIGKGAENNILIRDAECLEKLCKVTSVILDKTGTITEGKPEVTDVKWVENIAENRYLPILRYMESRSEHPLAEAVMRWLGKTDTDTCLQGEFMSVTGLGVVANIDGVVYRIGNQRLLENAGVVIEDKMCRIAEKWSAEGKTVIYFVEDKILLGMFAIADQVKSGSAGAISYLQGEGIHVYMLTGDNALTASVVAKNVGVDDFRAEVLPSDKADFVKELQERGEVVAMIGDGINDSQALAQADVSIAMGKGADIAIDVAAITLITSDLNILPKVWKLSNQTIAAIRQNLFWAFIYNVVGIPLAAGILYPCCGFLLNPMIAASAMAFSSVSVVLNSLRIKNKKL